MSAIASALIPVARRSRGRRPLLVISCLTLTGLAALAPATPPSASAEVLVPAGSATVDSAPHEGAWDGVDVFVSGGSVRAVQVRTYAHGHIYCVPLQKGWNAVGIEHATAAGSGAELSGATGCEGGSTGASVPNTVFSVKPGEHWHIDGDVVRCVVHAGGPTGQCH
ncbi:hypothetical protein CMMCAS03_10600 [Clavibacter michiganensis subsp. michiganensis]|nr:hypothetical protein DOU02_12080 [Clavibacter michiganensis subsp. michiganensis]SLJ87855.1 hypothetical protein SAMN06265879_0493 [Clavibacter michiganensis]OUD89947.1 hypothetical protein CMMCAS03_10600 [Clavibacter michiganensis subsp. michiganensis]OUD90211.1 hypothetical protein CMMCAS05_12035 [Clavibacter michiganensis subsp. michiganensis]OUE00003.1 hypothetical protein CMMCAS04_01925 [Clavibacter michiganensis subsp. michiganensis]